MLRDDLVERMIRQLAQALARVLGLRKRGDLLAAIEEADRGIATLGGLDPRLLEVADPATLAATIDPRRLAAVAQLLEARAEAEGPEVGGRADRTRTLAVRLLLEVARGGPLDPDAAACARRLLAAGADPGRWAAEAAALASAPS